MSRRALIARGTALGLGAATLSGLTGTRNIGAKQDTGSVSLTLWHSGEPDYADLTETFLEAFTLANPNVSIEMTFVGDELMNPTLIPALNAGEGPDIWMAGTGPGQPAAIIEAGHALDLTPYFCSLGWNEKIPVGIVNYTSSDGKLWAVGDSVETTLMFYNKDVFTGHNLAVPTTWDEVFTVCAALAEAGFEVPIGLAGADKWPISHWQSMLWGRFAGPEGVDTVMFGDGRWDEEPFVMATALLKRLGDEGCFGPDPLAELYDDIEARFWRGEIPMAYTGPWTIGTGINALGGDTSAFGVFQAPPADGKPLYPTEDIGTGWYVNARCENPEVAADVIDFMLFQKENRDAMLAAGINVPVGELDLEGLPIPPLLQEVFASTNEYRSNGTIHAFLDTVTPASMTDITYDGLQAVLAGQMSPEEFNAAVQSAWETAKSANEQLKPGGVACS